MSDRVQYINVFDYRTCEFKPLMDMILTQLNAGRDIAVTGHPTTGWTLSIPQNRDHTIRRKHAPKPSVEDEPAEEADGE